MGSSIGRQTSKTKMHILSIVGFPLVGGLIQTENGSRLSIVASCVPEYGSRLRGLALGLHISHDILNRDGGGK